MTAQQPNGTTTSLCSSELRFDGLVVVITGAGGGLGRSHALEFGQRGADVIVNDIGGGVNGSGASKTPAQRVVDEIIALGGSAIANYDSVATWEGGAAIVQAAIDAFGRIDILVNNAGILRDKAFHKMDETMVDAVLDVHLDGAFHVTLPAWKLMRAQGSGRIIFTTSGSGLFGQFSQANYGAAKTGLVGLTRVLAIEGKKVGIKVNAIGPIGDTRMTRDTLNIPFDAPPESVSAVVAFLGHDKCQETGNIYGVGGRRIYKICIVETVGAVLPEGEVTAEAVARNISQIGSSGDGYLEPDSLGDDIGLTQFYQRAVTANVEDLLVSL